MALSTLLIKLHTAVHCTDSRQMTGVALHSSVGVVKNVYSLVVWCASQTIHSLYYCCILLTSQWQREGFCRPG